MTQNNPDKNGRKRKRPSSHKLDFKLGEMRLESDGTPAIVVAVGIAAIIGLVLTLYVSGYLVLRHGLPLPKL